MNTLLRRPLAITAKQFEDMARKSAFTTIGRVELRKGLIELMAPVFFKHGFVQAQLTAALLQHKLDVMNEISVRCSEDFMPTCDIVVWDAAKVPANHDGPLPFGAVRLVIEVADTSLDDDLGDKMREYGEAGVPEYWVADVQSAAIFVHSGPQAGGYAERVIFRFGETIEAATFDLRLDVAGLRR
jgi:Uma2 family endonuclease